MNIFFKIGKIIFKIFAMFVILLALLLEELSKTKNLTNKKNNTDEIKKSFNTYPIPKHYGY